MLPTEKNAKGLEPGKWVAAWNQENPPLCPRKGKGLRRGADPVGPCRSLEGLWLYVWGTRAPCDGFPQRSDPIDWSWTFKG